MKKIKIKNERLLFTILIISAFVVFLLYYNLIFSVIMAKNAFANEMVAIADENEESIFNVQRVLMYNSNDQSLKNMSICQFTDISIYIDNTSTISELTDENTIKELYIDNIVATTNNPDMGTKVLNYKNPLDFGKYKDVENPENDRIDFNIIK